MNWKKVAIATIVVAIAWIALDYVIHGVLLMNQYQDTAQLWRPMDQMNPVHHILVAVVMSILYLLFYSNLVPSKNVKSGLHFGLWYGLIAGFSMGFGSYTYLPIPLTLAVAWFFSTLVQSLVVGTLTGWLTKN